MGKDEGDGWMAKMPSTEAEPNRRTARSRPNPFSESASNLLEDENHACYWLRSNSRRVIRGLETRKAHSNNKRRHLDSTTYHEKLCAGGEQSRRNVDLDSRTPSTQPEISNATDRHKDNVCLYKKLVDLRKYRPRVFGEGHKKRTIKLIKCDVSTTKRERYKHTKITFESIQQPAARSCKRSLDFTLENMEVEDQTTHFMQNRSGYDPKYLQVYQRKRQKVAACSNLQSVNTRNYGSWDMRLQERSLDMRPQELIDASVKRAEYQEISNGCALLNVNENTPITKDHLKAKLELGGQKKGGWKQPTDSEASEEGSMDQERWLRQERKLLRTRVDSFIVQMQRIQGDRRYTPWKCSVVDSVVGAFLTQNVTDTSSSSAFMSLAAKYPRRIMHENKPPQKNFASSASKARKGNPDCVEWSEVRSATVKEISEVIKERGMNNRIAERIKKCLDHIAHEQESIDLERLRSVSPDKAKKYLMSFEGLGSKSVECIRLLTFKHRAFPVDTNVARVVVRLGWVPIEPLPDGIQIHLLNKYPKENSVLKYLWPLLRTFGHGKLYELHYHMITFGKAFCTKRNPNCNACPMRVECEHFKSKFARRNTLVGLQEKRTSCPNRLITSLESKVEREQTDEVDIEDVVVDTTKAIGKARKAASVSALVKMRTEHIVYVLPNSHPLLERKDSEGPHCSFPYLLAVWTTTVEGADTSKSKLHKADTTEQDKEMVSGTLLIPCQRAMRGSFPLNGTYFQPNEVFADDESSRNPINVPWELIRNLTKNTLYCGTSVTNMLRGVSTEKMQHCFTEGFVCIRGFDQKTREPKPLSSRFHLRKGHNVKTRKEDEEGRKCVKTRTRVK